MSAEPLTLWRLSARPQSYLHAARLAAVPASGAVSGDRTAARFADWLAGRFDLPPLDADAMRQPAMRALTLPADDLSRALTLAGAAWHGAAVAAVVRGDELRVLLSHIGPEARRFALAQRGHWRAAPAEPRTADRLAETIPAAGRSALAAWCAVQPPAIGRRVLLRLPPSPDPDGSVAAGFAGTGPALFDAALAEVSV